jgi:putative nucleotidyltransferase with HDIG domain
MSLLNRPLYRTRQFFGFLRPSLKHQDQTDAKALLGERLWPLFASMSARDQKHSVETFRVLKERGCLDRDPLLAALLHDIGKGRLAGARVRFWHRVAYVLLSAVSPGLLRRVTRGRGGLANLHHHAERGAVVAEALGVGPRSVSLIRRHHDDDLTDEHLRMLREADDSC